MFKDFKKHIIHYIFLIAILSLGFGSFMLTGYDRSMQEKIAVLIALSYFGWGMIHHYLQDDLHPKIVVEYVLFSAIVLIVLFSLIIRA